MFLHEAHENKINYNPFDRNTHPMEVFIVLKRVLIALLCLLALSATAGAADTPWYAYLFNNLTRELIRVDADGNQQTYSLGLPENSTVSSYSVTFTDDGSQIAYCDVIYGTDGPASATLTVRDIAGGQNKVQMDLGQPMGCSVGRHGFSADGAQIAVSSINYYPGDPNADPNQPSWELRVIEIASGNVVRQLNALSPNAASIGTAGIQPDVRYFANNQIVFVAIPYGTEGASDLPAYLWQLDSDTVTPINFWGKSGIDIWQGSISWVDVDLNAPASNPGGPMPAFNVVKIAGKDGQARTVYHTAEATPADTRFIEGGARLAIFLVPAFDENNPDVQKPSKWVALDRMGQVADLQMAQGFSAIADAPGGYAYLYTNYQGENFTNPESKLDWVTPNGTKTLWSSNTDQWGLTWTAPVVPAAVTQDFPAWQQ
jgi:hypothetical protein